MEEEGGKEHCTTSCPGNASWEWCRPHFAFSGNLTLVIETPPSMFIYKWYFSQEQQIPMDFPTCFPEGTRLHFRCPTLGFQGFGEYGSMWVMTPRWLIQQGPGSSELMIQASTGLAYIYICMYIYVNMYVHICKYICIYVRIYVNKNMFTCINMYIYMYTCICVPAPMIYLTHVAIAKNTIPKDTCELVYSCFVKDI